MGHVNGHPLYNSDDTNQWVPESERRKMAFHFIDVLASLHSVDPDAVGLGELGKRDSYVARQLKTWYRSWTSSIEGADYDDPRAHELQRFFLENLPDQGKIRVVHGDYGPHNVLIGPDCLIHAVVDWEISTLGDPLADLAYALNSGPTQRTPSRRCRKPRWHRRAFLRAPSWRNVTPQAAGATCPTWTTTSVSIAGNRRPSSTAYTRAIARARKVPTMSIWTKCANASAARWICRSVR